MSDNYFNHDVEINMDDWYYYNGVDPDIDSDSPDYDETYNVYDVGEEMAATVWQSDSDSEPERGANIITTYSKECISMIRLIEEYRRPSKFLDDFPRFLSPIRASDFEQGASVISKEITSRIAVYKYASCYKFSEGIGHPGTQVSKRDLCDTDDILYRSGDEEETFPSYFKYFFVLSCGDVLTFSNFMKSVYDCLDEMTDYVRQDMKRHYKQYNSLSAIKNFRNDEFQKCLDELRPLRVQFKQCKRDLNKDYEYCCRARKALLTILNRLKYVQDLPISFEATNKLCRLRDFCSYSTVLYANSVLPAMEVMKSYSDLRTKLRSFVIV